MTRANYNYICEDCGKIIKKGSQHQVISSYTESHRTHEDCKEPDFSYGLEHFKNMELTRLRRQLNYFKRGRWGKNTFQIEKINKQLQDILNGNRDFSNWSKEMDNVWAKQEYKRRMKRR